jgi:hypothetical protein
MDRRGLCESAIGCNEGMFDQCNECNNAFCADHMTTHRCRGEEHNENEDLGSSFSTTSAAVSSSISTIGSSSSSNSSRTSENWVDLTVHVPTRKASLKTSWVWSYFTETIPNPTCDICKAVINYGKSKSTSALISHIQHNHRSVYDENLQTDAEKKRKACGSVEQFVVYGGNFMKEYIRWIVETFQPISTCDNVFFRRMCSALSPAKTQLLTSDTVLREMLKVKDQVTESMKEYLVGQYFSLTTDHWTSCANETYMAATLHYIDDSWVLRSLTLNCTPHTGETTGVLTKKLLKEAWESYNLQEKHLVAVVTDTAANMTAAGRLYPAPLIYCAAHTLGTS